LTPIIPVMGIIIGINVIFIFEDLQMNRYKNTISILLFMVLVLCCNRTDLYDISENAETGYRDDHIRFHTEACGAGSVIDSDIMLKGLNTLTIFAALYDSDGNYVEDVDVSWSGTGIISGNLNPVTGTSTSFLALNTEGSGTIIATHPEYGDFSTGTITVDNKIYLMESLSCWNYGSCGCSKAGGDWQVNGGQSVLGGSYALTKYAWPILDGLPQGVNTVLLRVFQDACDNSWATNYHYSVFPVTVVWNDSISTWATRPPHDQGDEKGFTMINCPSTNPDMWREVNITAYYNSWFIDPNFYGFALYTTASWISNTFHIMAGPGYSTETLRPMLRITKGGNTVDFVFVELP
jgi:hypothetical protein